MSSDTIINAWIRISDSLGNRSLYIQHQIASCCRKITLVSIAERACEPEVRFFCQATQRLGNNMVDRHRCADDSLLRQAVAAPMACGSGTRSRSPLGM